MKFVAYFFAAGARLPATLKCSVLLAVLLKLDAVAADVAYQITGRLSLPRHFWVHDKVSISLRLLVCLGFVDHRWVYLQTNPSNHSECL